MPIYFNKQEAGIFFIKRSRWVEVLFSTINPVEKLEINFSIHRPTWSSCDHYISANVSFILFSFSIYLLKNKQWKED